MKNEKRRAYKSLIACAVVAFMLCTPLTSLGWGAGGHMIVAFIAFKRLNPKAKAKANELLAIAINPAQVSARSKDFVNAAHWPDDLRQFPEFDSFKRTASTNLLFAGYSSSYHALQVKFDRKFSGGFATTTAYTFGKGMGFQTGDDGGLAFYINQRRNYARNDFDRTHTFVQSVV